MTLQEIDAALAAWDDRLAIIANNLLQLQADPTYQLLTGTRGCAQVRLSGPTAARFEPALAPIPALFEHFTLLQSTLERAAKIRRSLNTFFPSEAKLRELEQLLRGPSINLGEASQPLNGRMLLAGGSARSVRPDDLLGAMTNAFAGAWSAVTEVGGAWETLAAVIGQAEQRIAQIERRPGHTSSVALQMAAARLLAIRERVQADPLGASAALAAEVEPVLAETLARAGAAEELGRDLADARRRLNTLTARHHEAIAAVAEAQQKVENVANLPAPVAEARLGSLRDWLDQLDLKAGGGGVDNVRKGLGNWNAIAESFAQQEAASINAHRAAIDLRGELRGRLDALKAKARVYGVAEREDFKACATAAEMLLYRRPMDTLRAGAAVSLYEGLLRKIKREPGAL